MRCPKCKKDITWLMNYEKVEKVYSFDGDSYNELDEIFADKISKKDDFFCPECEALLAHSEDAARKLLENN